MSGTGLRHAEVASATQAGEGEAPPVDKATEMWRCVVGNQSATSLHCDIRFQGSQVGVYGRRKLGEAPHFIPVPEIAVVPGDWYHFYLTLAPSQFDPADRTYSLTVTREDAAGKRTYGTVRGILQATSQPIDWFAVMPVDASKPRPTGQLQIDNLVINTVKPFWVLPYTNVRGINWADAPNHMSEAGTYFDEWSMIDVADPRWEDAVAPGRKGEYHYLREDNAKYFTRDNGYGMVVGCWYDVDPVESMADMMLYYHKLMLDNGMADGIYWDDFFLKANYCPTPGPGYIGDDGKLHAGVNLYAFRNFLKRFATMQHVMGMRPLPYPHVTNTHIVPILSFSTLLLNLEDIGSGTINDDFQDRFNMDKDCSRVLTEMTGFQSGNISTIHDQFTGTNRPHLLRTALAVALTHEIKIATYETTIFFPTQDRLLNFGYGQPDCKVYRYWDGPQPVTASGAPVKLLVLQRPAGSATKAYISVGSFGEGGDVDLALDATALGLPAGYRVYDDETGTEISALAPNRYRVNLVKHEFKLIRVQ